jgi:hypothetical protein
MIGSGTIGTDEVHFQAGADRGSSARFGATTRF